MHHQLDNSKARLPPNIISHPLHVTPHLSTDPMPPASLPLETSQQPSTTIHIIATSGRAGMSEWLFLWFKLIQYLFYCWIFFGALCTIIEPLWCPLQCHYDWVNNQRLYLNFVLSSMSILAKAIRYTGVLMLILLYWCWFCCGSVLDLCRDSGSVLEMTAVQIDIGCSCRIVLSPS